MIRDSGRTIEVSIDRTSDPIGGGALSIAEKNCDEAPSVRSFDCPTFFIRLRISFFLSVAEAVAVVIRESAAAEVATRLAVFLR